FGMVGEIRHARRNSLRKEHDDLGYWTGFPDLRRYSCGAEALEGRRARASKLRDQSRMSLNGDGRFSSFSISLAASLPLSRFLSASTSHSLISRPSLSRTRMR